MLSSLFPPLPVDALLPELLAALATATAVLVHAPPGSGKTTRIPLALLDADWLGSKKIIMLEPRRLAARSAARHMARLLGEKVGDRVGYRTRLDVRVSGQTRIEVVTEGMLTRMIQRDPELSGYGCVIFDEFHERSVQADLGLALCLDLRSALRPDLRLVLMSATPDVQAVAGLLGACRTLSCPGQPFPVETRYAAVAANTAPEAVSLTIRHALGTEQGDILVFLPGAREIRRAGALLEDLGPDVDVLPLLGALSAAEQDRALVPAMPGRRKVVLATAIAETSLTIEGVRVVVDSGLARTPRFDPRSGMSSLVTGPASLATLEQRRGRAGRTGPGVCFRVWDRADEVSRKPFPTPEILETDLAPLALDLAAWGVTDPASLSWLTVPPEGAFRSAVTVLQSLHALDGAGRITSHGRELALLPLHPRLGHMVLAAKGHGLGSTALWLAALLAEPGQARRTGPDLRETLAAVARTGRDDLIRAGAEQIGRLTSVAMGRVNCEAAGLLTALAYPERLARRQEDGTYRLVSGRKAVWPGQTMLADTAFLAVADLDGDQGNARIWQAAPVSWAEVERFFGADMVWQEDIRFDPVKDRVTAMRRQMLGSLCVAEEPCLAEPLAMTRVLLQSVDVTRLSWDRQSQSLRDRVGFLRSLDQSWPDLGDQALQESIGLWLEPFVQGVRTGADLRRLPLTDALKHFIGWNRLAELERLAPEFLTVPSGAARRIDYSPESGPVLPVKLQEMFGCTSTPTLADGRYQLLIHLLSPAGRPLQVTRDLASFWRNSYPQVRAEMRGRYPKHPWPEDPLTALPTARTRQRS